MKTVQKYVLPIVMIWTVITTLFAWLPLVRIIARPDGYRWSIIGISGAGTEGPFWIFAVLMVMVLTIFIARLIGWRSLFFILLIAWHVSVTAVITAGTVTGGSNAQFMGEGLGFSLSLLILMVPCVLVTCLAAVWAVTEYRSGEEWTPSPWTNSRTGKLALSMILLIAGIVLFRAGADYNWVTAAAIITTVFHWIVLTSALDSGSSRELNFSPAQQPEHSNRRSFTSGL